MHRAGRLTSKWNRRAFRPMRSCRPGARLIWHVRQTDHEICARIICSTSRNRLHCMCRSVRQRDSFRNALSGRATEVHRVPTRLRGYDRVLDSGVDNSIGRRIPDGTHMVAVDPNQETCLLLTPIVVKRLVGQAVVQLCRSSGWDRTTSRSLMTDVRACLHQPHLSME